MNPTQLDEFRQQLDARYRSLRDEILQDLRHLDAERYQNIAGQVTDAGDASLADLVVDLNLFDTERDIQELRDVEAALGRIREGRYGQCIDCEEGIPAERLHAYPTAKRCHACQVAYEKSHPRV